MNKEGVIKKKIKAYMHCGKCLSELPSGESPESFSKLSIGWTDEGFQVWCNRHNLNVASYVMPEKKDKEESK